MREDEMKRRVTKTLESRAPAFGSLIEGDGAEPPPAPDWEHPLRRVRREAVEKHMFTEEEKS